MKMMSVRPFPILKGYSTRTLVQNSLNSTLPVLWILTHVLKSSKVFNDLSFKDLWKLQGWLFKSIHPLMSSWVIYNGYTKLPNLTSEGWLFKSIHPLMSSWVI